MNERKRAIVIGAGIGGLTAGIALRKVGIDCIVLDQAKELRPMGGGLAMMSNAMQALDSIGVGPAIRKAGEPIQKFQIRDLKDVKIADYPFAEIGEALGAPNVGISRFQLQQTLLDALGVEHVRLDSKCINIDDKPDGVTLTLANGSKLEAEFVIGADGIDSVLRQHLTKDAGDATPKRPAVYLAYLALTEYRPKFLETGSVYHFWGRGQRFGIVDVGPNLTSWWATKNEPADLRAGPHQAKLQNLFDGWPEPVLQCINNTEDKRIVCVRPSDRLPLSTWRGHRTILLGDAAHPMLESLGQGACQAIEDAVALSFCLAAENDLTKAFQKYEALRIPRTSKVVKQARQVADIEQWENPLAVGARNGYFRLLPRSAISSLIRGVLVSKIKPE